MYTFSSHSHDTHTNYNSSLVYPAFPPFLRLLTQDYCKGLVACRDDGIGSRIFTSFGIFFTIVLVLLQTRPPCACSYILYFMIPLIVNVMGLRGILFLNGTCGTKLYVVCVHLCVCVCFSPTPTPTIAHSRAVPSSLTGFIRMRYS